MERVDLVHEYGGTPGPTWRNAGPQSPFVTVIRVGQLADGRWYAERAGRGASVRDKQQGAAVYAASERGRRLAIATARRWMRSTGGEWTPG